MQKRIYLLSIFIIVLSCSIKAQNANVVAELPDARWTRIIIASSEIKVPDSVFAILKNYAFTNNLNEAGVYKNSLVLKPFFNNNLVVDDKIFAAEYLLKVYYEDVPMLPTMLIKQLKASSTNTLNNKK